MATNNHINYPEVTPSVMLKFLKENGFREYSSDDMFVVHCKKDDTIPPIKFPKQGIVFDTTVAGIIMISRLNPSSSIERLSELQNKEQQTPNRRI
ncbi:MAG: hypothetical protein WBF38_02790 [Nitrosotalea sp.]